MWKVIEGELEAYGPSTVEHGITTYEWVRIRSEGKDVMLKTVLIREMCASYFAQGAYAKFAFFQGYGNVLMGIKGEDRFADDLDALHKDYRTSLIAALCLIAMPTACILIGLMAKHGTWLIVVGATVGLIPGIKGLFLLYSTLKLKFPTRDEFNKLFA